MNDLDTTSSKSDIQRLIDRIPGLFAELTKEPIRLIVNPTTGGRHHVRLCRDSDGTELMKTGVNGYEDRTEELRSKYIDDLTEAGIAVV